MPRRHLFMASFSTYRCIDIAYMKKPNEYRLKDKDLGLLRFTIKILGMPQLQI